MKDILFYFFKNMTVLRLEALFGTIIKIGVIMQNKLNQNKTTEHPETKLIFGVAGVPPSSTVSWAWIFWL